MHLLYTIGFAFALMMAFMMTPIVKQFAVWVGAVDKPNHRKVHTRIMPRLGGLAIFLSFAGAFFIVSPIFGDYKENAAWGLLVGGAVIVLIGALDDRYELSAKVKLLGQGIAATIVVVFFDLRVDLVNIPFGDSFNLGNMNLGWLGVLLTIAWIVGVTNAINLIDGLDGLAAGVSGIATATMLVMAIFMGNVTVILLSAVLLGSIIGFLFFNFHPAKIFMGDSGALFLGFSLATLSVLGFKQVTIASFILPLLILGVPLSDTFFAILRRWVNKTPISVADRSHLHHCLMQIGLSHRQTVLVIYGIATVFGVCAIVLSQAAVWVTIIVTLGVLVVLEAGAEAIGIISKGKKPLLQLFQKLRLKTARPGGRIK